MESVAIIGMGCRFPGAPDIAAFWQFICNRGDAISEVPADRYDIEAVYDPRPATPGKVMSRYGGFLDQVDRFDAGFFGIAPREAAKIDPQHRLLLEVAWEAMEDAGLVPSTMSEEERLNIGCFIGVITGDYWDRQFRESAHLDVYATAGSARSGAAGRISFSQDLMGTSFAIDAACSSSLVAVDQAVQNLRSGACTMAVAGGVNVILNPDHTIGFSQGKMMAADGHCKTYDAAADGYVRSEGAGVVVLKLLERAQEDGDRIYAVIRGSASNNDGHCDFFMAPSTKGQQAGLRKACRNADVDPLSIDYVEAHGPGTRAGDPIEVMTLGEVLCKGRPSDQPLLVGSVKTNIGHTEGAAGVAGLIKTVLCLQYGQIPPNLHFHTPSPAIPWQDYALSVPTELQHWPQYHTGPHRAAVCSYGIAGTNTYVILEEAPQVQLKASGESSRDLQPACLLPISAHTGQALKDLARRYGRLLQTAAPQDYPLQDMCYTASVRRTHHAYRLAITGNSREDLQHKLAAFERDEDGPEVSSGHGALQQYGRIAWIFPGQGSQWLGMGRTLLIQEPVFRRTIEDCDRVMRAYVDWSLLEEMQADEAQSRLHEIDVVQPMLFAIEIALATLWRSWGVEPDVVVGHSMGEVAAAWVAGALSLEDAARIICGRSRLLRRVRNQGAMAVVEFSLEEAHHLISDYKDQISVAVSNSPTSTVLSGDPAALIEILASLERQGVFGRLIKVDVASHSPQMDPLSADLQDLLEGLHPRQTRIPFFSTVCGRFIDGPELGAAYWVQNLRLPVLFSSAIQHLAQAGSGLFMEISPHPLLVGAIRQTLAHISYPGLVLGSLRRQEDERTTLLATLGNLYVQGYTPEWTGLYPAGGRPISLPTYPWQRQRYWNSALEVPGSRKHQLSRGEHPLLGRRILSALQPGSSFWTSTLNLDLFPYLAEHQVHGMPVLPCAAYLELALAAGCEVFGLRQFTLEDLQLKKVLFFPKESTYILQITLTPLDENRMCLRFFSLSQNQQDQGSAWTEHASATLCHLSQTLLDAAPAHPVHEEELTARFLQQEASVYYQGLRTRGIQHGPLFQGISSLWQQADEVLGKLRIPEDLLADLAGYHIHPALMDAILQGITPFLPEEQAEDTYVPVGVGEIKFYSQIPAGVPLWTHALLHERSQGTLKGDVFLLNEQGEVLLEIRGFQLQSLELGNAQELQHQRLNQYLYTIQWEAQARARKDTPSSRKNWIIFNDNSGLGQGIVGHLRAEGCQCIQVTPDSTYQQSGPFEYSLSPTEPEHFRRLFTELYGEHAAEACHGIVYLWSMLTEAVQQGELNLEQSLAETAALHLVQAVAATPQAIHPRLWLVTTGTQVVEADDQATSLLQAPVWGLGRVIVYEHQDLHSTLIDIDQRPVSVQIEDLFAEIWSDNSEDEVALRSSGRYVARLTHARLPEKIQARPLCSRDATYLITGGLGGVGLRTAQWLVDQGAAHLVLMGRHDPSQEAAAIVRALQERGAEIRLMRVDISEEQQLADALAEMRSELPPLRGVFHSAVVLDDSTLLQLDQQRLLGVRPPRIAGAWNLHQLTLGDPLDYFVLFSSAASLIGSPGQGNYAAASAFLEQLAFYRRSQGYPALCINWGRWGEVGQAMREQRAERLDVRGFASIKPVDGLAILASLLRESPPQVGVMSFDLLRWSQFYPDLTRSSLFTHLLNEVEEQAEQQSTSRRLTREMLMEQDQEQRMQNLTLYISDQVARVLGYTSLKLETYQPLHRLGIDSLMSVELKNRMHSDLDIIVPVAAFLQGITLGELLELSNAQMQA